MYKKILRIIPLFILFAAPLRGSLQSDIDRASYILSGFSIPSYVLQNAKGVVVMSVVKGGFIFSGRVGSGLVVAHLSNGWSAPSALGTAGVGWGLQAGAKVTDFVLVLNTDSALRAFEGGGSVTLGGALSIAAGPLGGTAEGSLALPPAAIFSYGRSQGLFAGISLEGTVIAERSGTNRAFYGKNLSSYQILSGEVPRPQSASHLYNQLK